MSSTFKEKEQDQPLSVPTRQSALQYIADHPDISSYTRADCQHVYAPLGALRKHSTVGRSVCAICSTVFGDCASGIPISYIRMHIKKCNNNVRCHTEKSDTNLYARLNKYFTLGSPDVLSKGRLIFSSAACRSCDNTFEKVRPDTLWKHVKGKMCGAFVSDSDDPSYAD